MGNESASKVLRKQLKNVVQQALPEVISKELKSELYNSLANEIRAKLVEVTKNINDTLAQIDQRNKDVQSYILRNTTTVQAPESKEVTPE